MRQTPEVVKYDPERLMSERKGRNKGRVRPVQTRTVPRINFRKSPKVGGKYREGLCTSHPISHGLDVFGGSLVETNSCQD